MSSRAPRFRRVASQSLLLPPPLPLINLPEEPRLARTGVPSERPVNLPVRRHLPNSVAVCSLKAATTNPSWDFNASQAPQPELILRENRALLESEADEYEQLDVLARLHVYEYNQPHIAQNCKSPDDTLVFDSLFESGNLQRAERIFRKAPASAASPSPQQEYELLIHPDIKNGAYRQWFYFQVRHGRPGLTYRFSLVNLAKSGALFGQGLQPVVYSERDASEKGLGWRHGGTNVRYDTAVSPAAPPGANALTFHYQFEHDNDCVYFACIQPYTYTDLMDYLDQLEHDPQRSQTCRRTELCQSLAHNSCDMLSITSPGKDGIPHDERPIIMLSARVHPGEPNSSWMMQGMLDYLTGPSSGATILRRNFIFKVVPMLNPDGVINGNTRVSLAGWDLNRKWHHPIEQLFPTIYHLKQQLAHFQTRGRVAIYCDLHGHSLNRNIFTYGCYSSRKKTSSSDGVKATAAAVATADAANTNARTATTAAQTDPRVLPMIVARHAPCFSFANCDFSVHKSKATTARVVVHQELGVTNSYTLEASFCGPDFGTKKDTQFSTWDLEEMGRAWCQSLVVYYGLTAQVKALEAERVRQTTPDQQELVVPDAPTNRRARSTDGTGVDDEDSRLATDLLLDCEAAISALFAQSGVETNGVGSDDDPGALDSDLSDAEEEPIPPSNERDEQRRSPHLSGDVDAIDGGDGYESAPPAFSERKKSTSGGRTRKKARRKHSRGSSSKSKSAVGSTVRKSESKSKKKKKRKANSEHRPTFSTTASPSPTGPQPQDAALLPSEDATVQVPQEPEPMSKPLEKKAPSARRTRVKSSRPKSSSEVPRSVTSAILQATMDVDSAASRSYLRLRPMPRNPGTSLLVLPSVVDGSSRGGRVVPRILKTAPTFEHEYSAAEESNRFNLARIRSELPALQLSGRDNELRRRQSLRQKFRRLENDDLKPDDDSDGSAGRSERESFASSKALDLVSI